MKDKFKRAFIDVAERFAQLSSAVRLQVGAIIVKDDRIVSIGFNGTPAGWDNVCEDKEYMSADAPGWIDNVREDWPFDDGQGRYRLKTKPEVLHAERNALDKLAKSTESGDGATMFVTHSPCLECAKSIYGAGITTLIYKNDFRNRDGLEFLSKCGVIIEQIKND
jgi:dCMP deaminase